jgi:hypothetical protein
MPLGTTSFPNTVPDTRLILCSRKLMVLLLVQIQSLEVHAPLLCQKSEHVTEKITSKKTISHYL